jgi:hypothetical protein
MEILEYSGYTSSFRLHHTSMIEQNEDGGPHATSTSETFATRRATPIGRAQKESEREKLPISKMMGTGEERRMREIKMTKAYPTTQPFGLSRCLNNEFQPTT